MTISEILAEEKAKERVKANRLADLEAVLFDSYKILLELKEVWEQGTPREKHIIVQMAMVKAKIVIIKKKIRDL